MLSMLRVFLLFVLLAVPALSVNAADKVTTVPVHFTKGSHSASVKGSFRGYDTGHYTLAARAGQSMTVKISGSSNANFNVFAPGDQPGQATALGRGYVGGDWTGSLPADGTYTVQMFQMRASARRGEKVAFTLQIAIDGAANKATDTPAARPNPHASGTLPCARYPGQPTMPCPFTVTRGTGGDATVTVTHAQGFKRTIIFEHGQPTRADASQPDGDAAVRSSKESDLFFVHVGQERYEIPEAVVFGG